MVQTACAIALGNVLTLPVRDPWAGPRPVDLDARISAFVRLDQLLSAPDESLTTVFVLNESAAAGN